MGLLSTIERILCLESLLEMLSKIYVYFGIGTYFYFFTQLFKKKTLILDFLFYLNKKFSFFVYFYLYRERKKFDKTRDGRKK